MLDIKALRADPVEARRRLARRGDEEALKLLDRALRMDRERRAVIGEVEELKAERNRVSREIGERKRRGEDAAALILEMRGVAERIRTLDGQLADAEEELHALLLGLPNLPDSRVPEGVEGENEVVRRWGEPRERQGTAPHWELGPRLSARPPGAGPTVGTSRSAERSGDWAVNSPLDLERAAKVSGSGFPLLFGTGARLSRALIQLMLDLHTREHGYLEVAPPLMVNRDSMTATGHLPKFEADAYRTDPDDLFLVPTAEVPLTNLHRDEILPGEILPVAYVAYTPCFRREAGAAGRETRGLLRVHQFDKVELVRLCRAEDSAAELELLTGHAERVLELLELPYRRVLLPAGDLGFANAITYDLEIWSAGVGEWLEVSSCSCYGDYQARRANLRYRPEPGAGPEHLHTLNGSGLALARLIVALVENGYRAGDGVTLPSALHPYLGFERLSERP